MMVPSGVENVVQFNAASIAGEDFNSSGQRVPSKQKVILPAQLSRFQLFDAGGLD